MPRTQVASVPTVQLGPGNPSCVYRVRRGVKLQIRFEAETEDSPTVSIQVSPDNSAWSATTAGNNGQAVTSEAIVPGGTKDFSVDIRHQKDNYVRVIVTGGPVNMQIRNEDQLDIVKMPF